MKGTVGVLALQGAFAAHQQALNRLSVSSLLVRTPEELESCTHLILPGGESTAMVTLLKSGGLARALPLFAQTRPILGTCAGLILMASHILDDAITPFGFLDIDVQRNGFGRQLDSFSAPLTAPSLSAPIEGLFIRAPRIHRVGKQVQVLGSYKQEPVYIRQGHFFATTFHPELTSSLEVHKHFLTQTLGKKARA